MTTVETIIKDLKWLETNGKANNLGNISQVLNHIALHAVTLGEDVCNAYALMNELEDDYKGDFAKMVSESKESVAKAEIRAEAELIEKKKLWTQAKNGYKKLSTFLDRVDRTLESHRQSLSISKLEIKNI
jgi:hypothetical protein